MQRFRGGPVFKAHRRLYHSTLWLIVIKRRRRREGLTGRWEGSFSRTYLPIDTAHFKRMLSMNRNLIIHGSNDGQYIRGIGGFLRKLFTHETAQFQCRMQELRSQSHVQRCNLFAWTPLQHCHFTRDGFVDDSFVNVSEDSCPLHHIH